MNTLTLHANFLIKAPLVNVFEIITNFEKFPKYFPKFQHPFKS